MWQQVYLPVANSLTLSALTAAIPIFVLLTLIGIMRRPPWVAAIAGLATSAVVAIGVYGMPALSPPAQSVSASRSDFSRSCGSFSGQSCSIA